MWKHFHTLTYVSVGDTEYETNSVWKRKIASYSVQWITSRRKYCWVYYKNGFLLLKILLSFFENSVIKKILTCVSENPTK